MLVFVPAAATLLTTRYTPILHPRCHPPPHLFYRHSMGDTRFEEALFVRHKEGAGQQKQQLAKLAAAKQASGG